MHSCFPFCFLCLLLLHNPSVHTEGAEITCEVPTVYRGEPTNITCHFNEDVRLTKKNIKVQRRPPHSTSFDPDSMDTVAECYWLDAENSQCSAGDGYELKGSVGSVAVIEIAKATEDFVGKYMCEVVPSEPSDIKACEFQLKEEPRPTQSPDIEGELDTIRANLETVLSEATTAVTLCILTLTILLLTVLGGIILFLCHRFCSVRKKGLRVRSRADSPKCPKNLEGYEGNLEVQKMETLTPLQTPQGPDTTVPPPYHESKTSAPATASSHGHETDEPDTIEKDPLDPESSKAETSNRDKKKRDSCNIL